MTEFVARGNGTPYPWDLPEQLVTTGPYAYLANPMQVSAVLILRLLALGTRSMSLALLYLAGTCPICAETRTWIERRSPYGLEIRAAEEFGGGTAAGLRRARYSGPGGATADGGPRSPGRSNTAAQAGLTSTARGVIPRRRVTQPYIASMADILLGLLAILAGGLMLFAGQYVLRLILPIWGFVAGFAAGAGLVADLADERFLGTVLGWILGLVLGLVLAILAYFVYAVAVILAMASFGFAIGSGIVVAIGIDWNWVAVLVGLLVGGIVGVASIFLDMPMIVLIVIGSIAGAVTVVGGLMLLVGSLNSADFTRATFTETVKDSWGWYVTLLILAFLGIIIQARQRAVMRRTIHAYWSTQTP